MAPTDWSGWWWIWWPFAWIFFIFIFAALSRLVFGRRGWWGHRYGYWGHPYYGPPGAAGPHVPAEEILRQRLAKGEIDEAEYKRLMELLAK